MGSTTVAGRPPQSLRPLRQTMVKHLTQAATIADAALMIIVISTVLLALAVDLGAAIEWLRNRRR